MQEEIRVLERGSAYENFIKEFDASEVWEKIRMVNITNTLSRIEFIHFNGYAAAREKFAAVGSGGEYYCYIWKHMGGQIFYVGSGKGERWKDRRSRNDQFAKEIDAGDAVVYKVVRDISREESRAYEKYLSIIIGLAGITLANDDNNVKRIGREKSLAWVREKRLLLDAKLVKSMEDTLLNKIILDEDFTYEEIVAVNTFRDRYGNDYFSRGQKGHGDA